MRTDPIIDVTCDECGDETTWSPQFVYPSWSGRNGYYDTSDSAFEKFLKSEGWLRDDETDTDFCPNCADGEEA